MPGREDDRAQLLAGASYEDDEASLRPASEQASDSEGDGICQPVNNRKNGNKEMSAETKERRQDRRKARRNRERRRSGAEGEGMYELEEGHKSSSNSSGDSSEEDLQRLGSVFGRKTASPWTRFLKTAVLYTVIAIIFVALIFGAYRASRSFRVQAHADLASNGTTAFLPTTILISLDGFRADFLQRGLTPNLNALIENGVSPQYMLPSFPSVTFPNHFTLVTGLYPESHGIVGNTFWDPEMQEEFFYTDPLRSMQPKWWEGEPVWVTAENQGIRTAIHMWPGSEAHIGGIEPAYVDRYNGTETLSRKVNRVLELLDLPGPADPSASAVEPRPQLIAAYVPVVDADGHKYGPNSTEIRDTIKSVDDMLGDLLDRLKERNLTDIVNIVVVSDHGMATTSSERLIQLENIVDTRTIEHTDGWPLYGLRPKKDTDLELIHDRLVRERGTKSNFEVYLRDKDMPERYHFSKNQRIAPLWIVPEAGWAIVTQEEFDMKKQKGEIYHPRGLHGYDHEHPLMRAIFVAGGPAFPHQPGSRLDVFQNIEVYNIVCDSIGVVPRPNNGTLRLPLKPIGLHSDEGVPQLEIPHDLPGQDQAANGIAPTDTVRTALLDTSVTALALFGPSMTGSLPSASAPARPIVNDGANGDAERNFGTAWWDWVIGKYDNIKDWSTGLSDKVDAEFGKL
ncbi:type I phosphodiesterase/nucleotide pyrophosphatase [Cryomyces antarcticus]|nr:hypothetical protein LTR04_006538 [Oleoguttula sp. CCFEE 6159]